MRCATERGFTIRLYKQITSLHDMIMIDGASPSSLQRYVLHGASSTHVPDQYTASELKPWIHESSTEPKRLLGKRNS